MIVNLRTLERSFEICATFRPAFTDLDHRQPPMHDPRPVEAGRNLAHISKLPSNISKFIIIFYSWSHEQYYVIIMLMSVNKTITIFYREQQDRLKLLKPFFISVLIIASGNQTLVGMFVCKQKRMYQANRYGIM